MDREATWTATLRSTNLVVVLTLTNRYNAVRGHRRTGSNNSGAENYLRMQRADKM